MRPRPRGPPPKRLPKLKTNPPADLLGGSQGSTAHTRCRREVDALRAALWGIVLIALGWAFYRLVSGLAPGRKRMKRLVAVVTRSRRASNSISHSAGPLRNTARYTIIVLTVILLLDRVLGVNVVPILTGAGIIGIAVAFGSQSLVRTLSGVFQLLEGQYAVGDYVQIGTAFGKVEHIGLRITRLRDLQDKLYFIPNGTITMVTTYDDPSLNYVLQAPFSARETRRSAGGNPPACERPPCGVPRVRGTSMSPRRCERKRSLAIRCGWDHPHAGVAGQR